MKFAFRSRFSFRENLFLPFTEVGRGKKRGHRPGERLPRIPAELADEREKKARKYELQQSELSFGLKETWGQKVPSSGALILW
jgi:hypothetical protein